VNTGEAIARTPRPARRAFPSVNAGGWVVAGTVGFALVGMTLYGVSAVGSPHAWDVGIPMALGWINLLVVVGALVVEIRRRPYSLHLMHLLALFLFLGIAGLLQLSSGRFAVAGSVEDLREELSSASVAVSFWLVTYLLVYELRRRMAPAVGRDGFTRFFERPLSPSRVLALHLIAIAVLAYLGLIGLLGLTTRAAAEETLISNANVAAGGSGFALALKLLNQYILRGLPLIVMIAGFLTYPHARGGTRTLLRLLLPILVVGNMAANNPFAASRMWFVTVVFGALAPLLFRRTRTGLLIVALTLGGLAILPALHESRSTLTFGEWLYFFRIVSPVKYLASSADGDHLGMISLAVRWTAEHGHMWGLQTLGAIGFLVPRRIWPDKPIGTGAMVTGDLGFGWTNWSMPIVAEGFVDFSYPGVILLASVFGWVLARGDLSYWGRRDAKPDGRPRVVDVLYPFWLGCAIFFTRGDLIAAASHTSPFVFWAIALGFGARARSVARRQG